MKATILVVDDEKQICTVLAAYLEEKGFTVYQANDLASARSHLKNGVKPDLVVLDVMLGDGNGIVFVREIRKLPDTQEIPVIMMSAHRTKSQDKVTGLQFGADDYISKPFDLRELHLRIEKLLKPMRKAQAESRSPEKIEPRQRDDLTSVLKSVLGKNPPSTAIQKTNPVEKKPMVEEHRTRASGPTLTKELVSLLLQPSQFFSTCPLSRIFWIGGGCLLFSGILRGLQQGIEEKSVAVGFVSSLVIPAANISLAAAIAWIIQWGMGLRQKAIKFKPLFTALGLGFAPMVLCGFLGLLYVALASGQAGDFTAGPLLILPSQASSKYLGAFLRRIDFFELWAVWLAAVALHRLTGASRPLMISRSYMVWGLLALGFVLLKGFFA